MIREEAYGLHVRVKSITYETLDINSYTLESVSGNELPPFEAGAHIDLNLPNGLVRSYSLINSQEERHRYVVAINKAPASRGGSTFIHENLHVGEVLSIGQPRNNFPLIEDAHHSVFVAGGVGITPLYSMIRRLTVIGRPWQLYYCVRNKIQAAFLNELLSLSPSATESVHTNFSRELGDQRLDLDALIATIPNDTHLYCCGPVSMLETFERATTSRPVSYVHVEYFAAKEVVANEGGFTIELARTGRSFFIPSGKTILQVLLEAGMDVPHACMEGVCSACETRVLEGVPDHLDMVLNREERDSNRTMMICCSGCKSQKLVLDI
jgi:tetrachlorobenzoquinone reductase